MCPFSIFNNYYSLIYVADHVIRIGLVARISRSHRDGRGSIPRYGIFLDMSKDAEQIYSSLKNIFALHNNELTSSHADYVYSMSNMSVLFYF